MLEIKCARGFEAPRELQEVEMVDVGKREWGWLLCSIGRRGLVGHRKAVDANGVSCVFRVFQDVPVRYRARDQ